jgi:hypothetical protein
MSPLRGAGRTWPDPGVRPARSRGARASRDMKMARRRFCRTPVSDSPDLEQATPRETQPSSGSRPSDEQSSRQRRRHDAPASRLEQQSGRWRRGCRSGACCSGVSGQRWVANDGGGRQAAASPERRDSRGCAGGVVGAVPSQQPRRLKSCHSTLLALAARGRGKLDPLLARTREAGGRGQTLALSPTAILGGPGWRRCGWRSVPVARSGSVDAGCTLRKDRSRAERRVWPGALAIELRPG